MARSPPPFPTTRGVYPHDKFHTPIALGVNAQCGSLSAVGKARSRGEFELQPDGGTQLGTWRDKDHRRALAVILQ